MTIKTLHYNILSNITNVNSLTLLCNILLKVMKLNNYKYVTKQDGHRKGCKPEITVAVNKINPP